MREDFLKTIAILGLILVISYSTLFTGSYVMSYASQLAIVTLTVGNPTIHYIPRKIPVATPIAVPQNCPNTPLIRIVGNGKAVINGITYESNDNCPITIFDTEDNGTLSGSNIQENVSQH